MSSKRSEGRRNLVGGNRRLVKWRDRRGPKKEDRSNGRKFRTKNEGRTEGGEARKKSIVPGKRMKKNFVSKRNGEMHREKHVIILPSNQKQGREKTSHRESR